MCVKCAQRASLAVMEEAARELGVSGVFMALITYAERPLPWEPSISHDGRFQRPPDPAKGEDDMGASYLSVCLSKWAEMEDTGQDSGTVEGREPKKGECGYRGGVTKEVGPFRLYTSFSGGTQEQDVLVAQVGMDALENALHAQLRSAISVGYFSIEAEERGVFNPRTAILGGFAWIGLTLLFLWPAFKFVLNPILDVAREGAAWSYVAAVVLAPMLFVWAVLVAGVLLKLICILFKK